MASRRYPIYLRCIPGCNESSTSESSTRQDQRDALTHYQKNPWRCFRHRKPDEVLSVDNAETSTTLVVFEHHHGMFWGPEGSEKGTSGLEYGPGFRAIAKDFPAGTRLVVTARVEYPADTAH